jgi:hypothetical protein
VKDIWYKEMKGVSDHWPIEIILYAHHHDEYGWLSGGLLGLGRDLKRRLSGVHYHPVQGDISGRNQV